MNHPTLVYTGSFLLMFWGIAHLFPTWSVVRGFGAISIENNRIILMEWITEGFAIAFIGALTAVVTYIDPSSPVTRSVIWMSFGVLNVLSSVSLFTGFRNSFLPYKLCPIIFTGSSVLILLGGTQ